MCMCVYIYIYIYICARVILGSTGPGSRRLPDGVISKTIEKAIGKTNQPKKSKQSKTTIEKTIGKAISKTIGRTKETEPTKEIKATTSKNHRENYQTGFSQKGHNKSLYFVIVCFKCACVATF